MAIEAGQPVLVDECTDAANMAAVGLALLWDELDEDEAYDGEEGYGLSQRQAIHQLLSTVGVVELQQSRMEDGLRTVEKGLRAAPRSIKHGSIKHDGESGIVPAGSYQRH